MLSHSKEISLTIVMKFKAKEKLDHTVNLQEITQQTLQGLQSPFYTVGLYRALWLIWTVIADGPCTSSYYIGLVKLQKKEKNKKTPHQWRQCYNFWDKLINEEYTGNSIVTGILTCILITLLNKKPSRLGRMRNKTLPDT